MPPCDLPCVPHAFTPRAHPFLCVILRVLPMSSSASSRVPHRVSPCTFHVSPQFPSWHATVRSSVRPAVRLSVRPSVFPVMCPTVRPSVCPSVRPVCVLLRVLLVSSNVSIRVPTVFLHAPPMDGGGVVYQGLKPAPGPNHRQTDRQTDIQTDRQTDGQTDRQTDRRTDRPTDRQR